MDSKQQLKRYTALAEKAKVTAAAEWYRYRALGAPNDEVAKNLWGTTAAEIQLKMRAAEAEIMKVVFAVRADIAENRGCTTSALAWEEPPLLVGVMRSDTRGIERCKVTPVPIKRGAAPRESLHWTQIEAPFGAVRLGGMWGAR